MSVEYRCDRCRSTQEVNDGLLAFYHLADGRSFCGPYATGWCRHCRDLSDVEEIPDPADLRRRLAQLDQFSAIHHVDLNDGQEHLRRHCSIGRRPEDSRRGACGAVDSTSSSSRRIIPATPRDSWRKDWMGPGLSATRGAGYFPLPESSLRPAWGHRLDGGRRADRLPLGRAIRALGPASRGLGLEAP
jgi:hypothetical protein